MKRRNRNETQVFVKLYLSHRRLWDTKDHEYKIKQKRQESIRDVIRRYYILTNVKFNEYEAKTKIRNIRSTYFLELNKIKHREDYTPKLQWFEEFHKAMTDANYQIDTSDLTEQQAHKRRNNNSQQVSWMSKATEEENSEDDSNHFVVTPIVYNSMCLKKEHCQGEAMQQKKPFKNGKIMFHYRDPNTDHSKNESITFADPLLDLNDGQKSNSNEFDAYGRYVASTLKTMGLRRALCAQVQIQNILKNARLECLEVTDMESESRLESIDDNPSIHESPSVTPERETSDPV